jgi:hypothetical protein
VHAKPIALASSDGVRPMAVLKQKLQAFCFKNKLAG